jgi:hypothetical protein
MTQYKKFEIDIAFEDESFEEVLQRLGKALPNVFVRIIHLKGSGGGWPNIEVVLPENEIRAFAEWFCKDDADTWEEEILAELEAL